MPGITGIFKREKRTEPAPSVDKMVRCMVHESFYTSGTYINDDLNLQAGWTALKDSFADCLPVWNEKRDVALIFSGEDFADPSVVDALRAKGHVFENGNASYLVHLYEELGAGFLEKLNGWFSGIVMDLREKKILLFNDRYGANRIFYHENERGLFFSSEAKAILKVAPETRQLDLKSLGEFLSCGSVLQNRTLFSGISMMPGGSVWTLAPGQPVRKDFYFRKEQWESLPLLDPGIYYEKIKETWTRILPKYFRGKQKVGLSLTGGVDSRMILAWVKSGSGELPCYTWGGSYRDCKDVTLSRLLADICKQPHQTIPVAGEFLSEFPALAEKAIYISDGGMDVVGAIDVYVQRKARQIAPVRLGGVYGGEILRRLVMFKPVVQNQGILAPELAAKVNDSFATYRDELSGNRLSFTVFKQAPWHMTGKFSIEGSQVVYRTPYFDNDLVSLAYQSPPESAATNEVSLRLITDGNPAMRKVETDRALSYDSIPGLTRMMHAYQEFTFKAEYAYDYGMPQWLAKMDHAVAPLHLEKIFLGRHKFHHFRVWYRDALSKYLRDVLLDSRTRNRPYLRAAGLEEMVNGHTKGSRNHTLEIHKMLALELVQRKLIETNGA
jgi:asparagine synthase (glutamine-hydrolysing)